MNIQEIYALLNRNPAFHLATLENGEPRVRGMFLYRADSEGIVFHTGPIKEVHHQLLANPSVEMCFNDFKENIQVRVRGEARLVPDQALKQEIVNAPGREFLRPWVEKSGYDMLSVFRIINCRASVWTMATNFDKKSYVELR